MDKNRADLLTIIQGQRWKQSIIAVIAFCAYVMGVGRGGRPFQYLPNLGLGTGFVCKRYIGAMVIVFAVVFIAIILSEDDV